MSGTLFVVATPIGNLADITLRALEVLKAADVIACENRERHLKLLNHYGIHKRLIEYSPANERNSANGIVKLLQSGQSVALVTDAGVPGVSDPGRFAVEEARKNGMAVVPVPGPSALTTLLSVCGFSGGTVVFAGFLSKSEGKIRKELYKYKELDCTLVLYVSSHQIRKVLGQIQQIFGNAEILMGREMTKANEEFRTGTAERLLEGPLEERGEFTLAVRNNLKPGKELE